MWWVGIDEERVLAIGQILAERQSAVGDDVPSEQLRPRCRAENTFQRLAALAGRGLQDDFCRYVAKLLYTGHDVVRLIVGYCEHSLKGTYGFRFKFIEAYIHIRNKLNPSRDSGTFD